MMDKLQTADTVLMIRPAAFRSNPETAATNAFQDMTAMPAAEAADAALAEFEAAVTALENAGVGVCVVDDTVQPSKPDAVFPNNWLSTHQDGTVVLYPMMAPSRRPEVRRDVVDALQDRFGFRVERVVDLSTHADSGRFLEGTGSMVLDRVARVAYACRSPRTDDSVLHEFCIAMDFEPFVFDAADADGVPIYHTNVQMWIGERVAAACMDAITDTVRRDELRTALLASGRELVELSLAQMAAFAGNALELRGSDGEAVIALSASAHAVMTESQLDLLRAHARLAVAGVPSIERSAGGSIRCMLAEIFLPR